MAVGAIGAIGTLSTQRLTLSCPTTHLHGWTAPPPGRLERAGGIQGDEARVAVCRPGPSGAAASLVRSERIYGGAADTRPRCKAKQKGRVNRAGRAGAFFETRTKIARRGGRSAEAGCECTECSLGRSSVAVVQPDGATRWTVGAPSAVPGAAELARSFRPGRPAAGQSFFP